jgi:hypothetical protein
MSQFPIPRTRSISQPTRGAAVMITSKWLTASEAAEASDGSEVGQDRPDSRAPTLRFEARHLAIPQGRTGCYAFRAICCRTWEGSMRSRIKTGSVVRVKRDKVWRFYFWENGKRKSRLLGRFPTKAAAWEASKPLRDRLEAKPQATPSVPTVSTLVEEYKAEKMPDRKDTHRTYKSWIHVHVLPKWGQSRITDLQARPVEKWLESLPLAPKSRVHIRGILSSLWNFAMWTQAIPMQVNPISLVKVKGACKRVKQPRSLTVEGFQKLCAELGHMGTHTFRHSYRMWIDAIGTPVGVQQKLMRHSDIRTTMNIYGHAATEDMLRSTRQNRAFGAADGVTARKSF